MSALNPILSPVDRNSRSEAKIALFRSLFRGRDDVYPRRFESRKTGKTSGSFLASVRRQAGAELLLRPLPT